MAALTEDFHFNDQRSSIDFPRLRRYVVEASEVIYAGALVGVHDGSGAGERGEAVAYQPGVAGVRFAGLNVADVVTGVAGNTEYVTVDMSGLRITQVAVTGVTANTDVGEPVYSTSDNLDDLTLTETGEQIGVISARISGTECDVDLLPSRLLDLGPGVKLLAPAYTADGAIALPSTNNEIVDLDASAANTQMTLAAPGANRVGLTFYIRCIDTTNVCDVDYTAETGAATKTFAVAGDVLVLFAATATNWKAIA